VNVRKRGLVHLVGCEDMRNGRRQRTDLGLLFLGDVRPGFRDIPSSCFTEPVPEIVEGGEVPGFDCNHSVVGGAPDVGIFRDYFDVFGQVLLELFPTSGRFLLVSFG
jgi:hypothetical protein